MFLGNAVKEVAQGIQPRLPHAVQELVLSSYFWVKSRRIHGSTFAARLEALDKSESLGADQLNDLQSVLLRRVIAAARHTRHYGELFHRLGIDPESIRTPEDLAALPLLEKEAVRRDPEAFLDGRRNRRSLHVACTSGTTGTPLRLYFSPEYEAVEEAFLARQWRWAGFSVGSRRVRLRGDVILPAGETTGRPWLRNYADRELRMSSYHLDARTIRSYVERINRFHPQAVVAYPSSAALLAALTGEEGLECHVPLVFTSSESLSSGQRELVQRQLGARIFDHYGTTEAVVAIQECESGMFHVIPEYGIAEFIRHEGTGTDGLYEIVGTGFTNEAMPLLRYRTGDYARVVQGASCSCGRRFPVVEEIFGRDDDFVATASGALAGRLDHVFKGLRDIVEAQIIQERDGSVRVLVVPGQRFSAVLRDRIAENLRRRLGELPVVVEEVAAIPRGVNGKFRAVVSHKVRTEHHS